MEIKALIANISAFSGVIPVLVSLLYFKSLTINLKIFLIYLIMSVITEIVSRLDYSVSQQNDLIINIYSLLEFVLLLLFFITSSSLNLKKVQIWLLLGVLVISQYLVLFSGISELLTRTQSILSFNLVIIGFSFFLFYKIFINDKLSNLLVMPEWWINFGIFTYFAGTLFLFLVISSIIKLDKEVGYLIWTLNNVFAIFGNALFTIGLWQIRKSKI